MRFTKLTEKEFKSYAENHPQGTFYQTPEWAKLKKTNGWKEFYVGVKENDKIIAASLLLKQTKFKVISFFYSPRGFLLDYSDSKLLSFFTENIKKFAKKENGIFIKIDPYVLYKERNIDGDIIENGIDNTESFNNLINLNYKHNGFNLNQEDLQPRFAFVLNLENKSVDDIYSKFETTTKQMIRKNERLGLCSREIKLDELDKFTCVMQDTAKRRGFIDRPFSYYENMVKTFKDKLKIYIAELDVDNYITELEKNLSDDIKNLEQKEKELENGKNVNPTKMTNRINEIKANIERLEKKIVKAKDLKKEKGKKVVVGGLLFMIHNNEIISLFGGAYSEYKDFMAAYTLNWDMIKYGIENNYKKYNFYGISGDFKNKKNELYGLYDFKRGFGGNVEEYLGEFDLVISPLKFKLYKLLFKIYKSAKK